MKLLGGESKSLRCGVVVVFSMREGVLVDGQNKNFGACPRSAPVVIFVSVLS
jgi:hypothetical protein